MYTPSDEAISWFFMGDGGATICVSKRKEKKGLMGILGHRIHPRVSFTNTDLEICSIIKNWLDTKGILYNDNVQDRGKQRKGGGKYLPLEIINIQNWEGCKTILPILLPHLIGRTKTVCEIMRECLSKYGGRGDWRKLMREKIIRDPATGQIIGVNWDVDAERRRFLEIMKYREKILKLNGGRRSKYSYDYFVNLWGMGDE